MIFIFILNYISGRLEMTDDASEGITLADSRARKTNTGDE